MNQEQVKQMLSTRKENYYQIAKNLSDYVLHPDNFAKICNHVVTRSKANKGFDSLDMFKFFYEEVGPLVEGTNYCPSKYNAQMLLKNVWETSRFQLYAVQQIKNNYAIIEIAKAQSSLSEEEKKQQRLKAQAEKMRLAKAKKAAERKALKDAKQTQQAESQARIQQIKSLTPEQQAQLDLLKKLKV